MGLPTELVARQSIYVERLDDLGGCDVRPGIPGVALSRCSADGDRCRCADPPLDRVWGEGADPCLRQAVPLAVNGLAGQQAP